MPSSYHAIELTSNQPVWSNARQLPPDKFQAARTESTSLLKAGIIRESKSAYAWPLHMVPKKCSEWRHCGDYRKLNSLTKPYRYPLPRIMDIISRLDGKTCFSKHDLVKAYYNIPVHPDGVPKTSFCFSLH